MRDLHPSFSPLSIKGSLDQRISLLAEYKSYRHEDSADCTLFWIVAYSGSREGLHGERDSGGYEREGCQSCSNEIQKCRTRDQRNYTSVYAANGVG